MSSMVLSLALALTSPFFLAACGAPPGSPGKLPNMAETSPKMNGMPPGMPPGASMPAMPSELPAPDMSMPTAGPESKTITADKPDPMAMPKSPMPLAGGERPISSSSGMDSLDLDGYSLRLASGVITAGSNPFLNRLNHPIIPIAVPVSTDPNTPAVAAEPPPPPVDPLTELNLVGILFNSKAPMALISVEGEDGSRMVRVGEKFGKDPSSQLRVTAIKRDHIEFKTPGLHGRKRILSIASIIGKPDSDKTAEDTTNNAAVNAYNKNAPLSDAGTKTPDLSNLSKLMDLTGGASLPGELTPVNQRPKR